MCLARVAFTVLALFHSALNANKQKLSCFPSRPRGWEDRYQHNTARCIETDAKFLCVVQKFFLCCLKERAVSTEILLFCSCTGAVVKYSKGYRLGLWFVFPCSLSGPRWKEWKRLPVVSVIRFVRRIFFRRVFWYIKFAEACQWKVAFLSTKRWCSCDVFIDWLR